MRVLIFSLFLLSTVPSLSFTVGSISSHNPNCLFFSFFLPSFLPFFLSFFLPSFLPSFLSACCSPVDSSSTSFPSPFFFFSFVGSSSPDIHAVTFLFFLHFSFFSLPAGSKHCLLFFPTPRVIQLSPLFLSVHSVFVLCNIVGSVPSPLSSFFLFL